MGVLLLGQADAGTPKITELPAEALRAGTLAYPSFEEHLRQGIPEADELREHLRNAKNYLVAIDDQGDYFSVAFIPVGHPALELRRGGGWQCLISPNEWRVIGCHRMK